MITSADKSIATWPWSSWMFVEGCNEQIKWLLWFIPGINSYRENSRSTPVGFPQMPYYAVHLYIISRVHNYVLLIILKDRFWDVGLTRYICFWVLISQNIFNISWSIVSSNDPYRLLCVRLIQSALEWDKKTYPKDEKHAYNMEVHMPETNVKSCL